jgi:hypothetical protein
MNADFVAVVVGIQQPSVECLVPAHLPIPS